MKTIAALILVAVALMLPSSLFAEPIDETVTFEQTLTIAVYVEHPGFGELREPVGIVLPHYIPDAFAEWHVPTFDPALGTALALELYWTPTDGHVIVTSDPPGVVGSPILLLTDNISGVRAGADGVFALVYPLDSLPITWGIWIHPDSHATYDIGYSATFDILLTGPATATYHYIPAAAIPEPTSLLLLGSGLIGAEWKRRRQHH